MYKDVDYYALGKRIRTARINKSLTQEQLAEICDLSAAHIGHIERGTRILSVDVLFRLANALEVSVDSLLFDSFDNIENIFTSLAQELKNKDNRKVHTFMIAVNALAEKIDEF